MPISIFLFWLLLVWLLGWLALPLAHRIWGGNFDASSGQSAIRNPQAAIEGGLPDAGLAAGRVLALVLWTLLAFWGGSVGVPVRWSALLIFPLGILCLMIAKRN